MASKLGTILSLFFFAFALFMGVDLLKLQFLNSALEAFAVSLGEQIAIEGRITEKMKDMAEEKYGAELVDVTGRTPSVGEFLEYSLTVDYTPIIISSEVMTITITRMVLIGYMD